MRTTTLKGLLSVLVFMTLCVVSAKAVNITQQITIYMDEAGKLPDKISSSEKYQITNLKIIGKIDGTDVRMIREMAGRDVDGNATNGNLAILDLSEAQIVSGGKYYYYILDSYTKNNILGEYAFYDCSNLTSVTLPNSVTSIGQGVFYGCTGLTSVEIPSSVTSIGNYAFEGCTGLTYVTIPSSVTSIGKGAFASCSGLESILVAPENSTYDSRDNCNAIIETKTNTLIAGCKNTTIPNSVTSIGEYAFYECTGLTSVTIPNSVTNIEYGAFWGCTGLEKIESLAETPPTCGSYVFYNVDKNKCVLSVPEKSINAYKTAYGWKDFLQIISGISGVAQDNNAGVSARDGEITVTGVADNAVVEVYSTSGALVYRGASKTVSVPSAGIYIVKAAGRTLKVKVTR